MRRLFRAAVPRAFERTLIASDGVTDDDRRWWEWHIPAKLHKGRDTTVLYCDGVGKYTWKMLIEREVFTIEQLSKITDDQVAELERDGCTQVLTAREHAKVFIETMDERERELTLQQSSWDKEVERLIEQREQTASSFRRGLEASSDKLKAVCDISLFYNETSECRIIQIKQIQIKQERAAVGMEQQNEVQAVVDAYDFGKMKSRRHTQERYDQELGRVCSFIFTRKN